MTVELAVEVEWRVLNAPPDPWTLVVLGSIVVLGEPPDPGALVVLGFLAVLESSPEAAAPAPPEEPLDPLRFDENTTPLLHAPTTTRPSNIEER